MIYTKREWPIYTDNEFLYDCSIGLGLRSLEEEVAKDIVWYMWTLNAQGAGISELWKNAWRNFLVGVEEARTLQWKGAVEMLTDMEVNQDLPTRKEKSFSL